jgi:hypothetical protein
MFWTPEEVCPKSLRYCSPDYDRQLVGLLHIGTFW